MGIPSEGQGATAADRLADGLAHSGERGGAEQPGDGYGEALDPVTLERMIRAITASGKYKIVERMERRPRYRPPCEGPIKTAVLVDVETTGLEETDRVIQLAMVPFEFDADGHVYGVGESEVWFEDPGIPIPPDITRLTGITQDDVAGHRIDEARVQVLLNGACLVIAHNVSFDRRMLEARMPAFADKHWACSKEDVPWKAEGIASASLEFLAYRVCLMFYPMHRADSDCYMTIHLLASTLPSGPPVIGALLESARRKSVRVWAVGTHPSTRHALKKRGYRWSDGEDGRPKSWWREMRDQDLPTELTWLSAHAYEGKPAGCSVQRFGSQHRYSPRADLVPFAAFLAQ